MIIFQIKKQLTEEEAVAVDPVVKNCTLTLQYHQIARCKTFPQDDCVFVHYKDYLAALTPIVYLFFAFIIQFWSFNRFDSVYHSISMIWFWSLKAYFSIFVDIYFFSPFWNRSPRLPRKFVSALFVRPPPRRPERSSNTPRQRLKKHYF